ncbi:hypothetical protein AYO21_06352 [Fonsecaea monophora]|uniref:Zn(2)-C6 fungal-type domain-containing protein n=1 Tax=Fonsecaea monophora TaxID=254056 RepID=A0A177F653_9EURO|nr:hypothetical protein AYO21_06352 [Fonsecaea monophora]OAG39336.1 hypothetical protein AYO21_06352 [Fonsecaea monophora]
MSADNLLDFFEFAETSSVPQPVPCAEDTPKPRQPRNKTAKRASKACRSCRARKVRCDFVYTGAPCTNCKLDRVDCIIPDRIGNKAGNGFTKPKPLEAAEPNGEHNNGRGDIDGLTGQPRNARSRLYQYACGLAAGTTAQEPRQPPTSDWYKSPSQSSRPSRPSLGESIVDLAAVPGFIKPPLNCISATDLAYLTSQGALQIPSTQLREELLNAFIEHVYPFLPLVNVHELASTVASGDASTGQLSLTLFQALMLAGTAFVDIEYLLDAGYSSRSEATKEFVEKVKLLCKYNFDSDKIVTIQSLLLMAYCTSGAMYKDNWRWIDMAISTAYSINLHYDPMTIDTGPGSDSATSKRLRKRLWWCVFMLAQQVTLSVHIPCKAPNDGATVPVLSEDDFEIVLLPPTVRWPGDERSLLRDTNKQRLLAVMCVNMCKLSACFENILGLQYQTSSHGCDADDPNKRSYLIPRGEDVDQHKMKWQEDELGAMLAQLPHEAQNPARSAGDDAVDVHISLFHMFFCTVLSILYAPQMFPRNPGGTAASSSSSSSSTTATNTTTNLSSSSSSSSTSTSTNPTTTTPLAPGPTSSPGDKILNFRTISAQAACAITTVAQRLVVRGLIPLLPSTSVSYIVVAGFTHVSGLQSPSYEVRAPCLHQLRQCLKLLESLREDNAGAQSAISFLEAATRRLGMFAQ